MCVSGYIEGLRRQIYHRTPKAKMVYVSGYIEGPGGKYTTGHLEPTWAVLKASGARQLYILTHQNGDDVCISIVLHEI